jgi:hypothetical protein
MSIHEVRVAHWRIARNPAGKEIELHPWLPNGATALKTATIRHCAGCTACGDAVECDPPCDDPRWCNPESPCEGLRTAQEWARRHIGGAAPAVVATPVGPKKDPAPQRPRWTAEEDDWVRNHADLSPAEVAEALGRSEAAIHSRRHHLGLTQPSVPWAEHEDQLLRGCTSMRSAMAMLPGRTRTAIKHRAGFLGLSFRRVAA